MSSTDVAMKALNSAGIPLNGSEPWSIHIHDQKVWNRVISQKQLGFAESYMEGWWDCQSLDVMLTKLLSINVLKLLRPSPALAYYATTSRLRNNQTKNRAQTNASHHYNIGNDLYARMLDSEMVYSCGYWSHAESLEQAQQAKFDLICRKLELRAGMKLLDIGCGWGGFLRYAVKKYGVQATGISLAENQISWAEEKSQGLGIKFVRQDYRDLTGQFDRIVSIGMLEHIGPKNFGTFFEKCNELLTHDGQMSHDTIASNVSKQVIDPFLTAIFFRAEFRHASFKELAGALLT